MELCRFGKSLLFRAARGLAGARPVCGGVRGRAWRPRCERCAGVQARRSEEGDAPCCCIHKDAFDPLVRAASAQVRGRALLSLSFFECLGLSLTFSEFFEFDGLSAQAADSLDVVVKCVTRSSGWKKRFCVRPSKLADEAFLLRFLRRNERTNRTHRPPPAVPRRRRKRAPFAAPFRRRFYR